MLQEHAFLVKCTEKHIVLDTNNKLCWCTLRRSGSPTVCFVSLKISSAGLFDDNTVSLTNELGKAHLLWTHRFYICFRPLITLLFACFFPRSTNIQSPAAGAKLPTGENANVQTLQAVRLIGVLI